MKMGILSKARDMELFGFETPVSGGVCDIPTEAVRPNPSQPRKNFDAASLAQLARSISQDGIIQPLTVRDKNGYYELVSGERRLKAAKIAGLRSVPCIIADISDERSAVYALIENIQREDLNFYEQASAIARLISEYGLTQEDAALRLGLSQPAVANKLRLLKLSDEEALLLISSGLGERHARALLRIPDKDKRREVIQYVIKKALNAAQTEKYISSLIKAQKVSESYKKRAPILRDIRLFLNTMNKAVKVMQLAGVKANAKKVEHEGYVDYIVSIPV